MNLRRTAPFLASGVLLVAGGFAAASIASGGGLRGGTTGTTGLTGTGPLPSKVTICHHTHSRKHPSHTITISSHAWPAHARHGDTLGACTQTPTQTGALTKKHGHGHGHGNQAPSQVSGAQHGNSDHGNQNGQPNQSNSGEGQGNGNGNGNGHSEGHGHGHP
jgi:hypothetical protein